MKRSNQSLNIWNRLPFVESNILFNGDVLKIGNWRKVSAEPNQWFHRNKDHQTDVESNLSKNNKSLLCAAFVSMIQSGNARLNDMRYEHSIQGFRFNDVCAE